MDKLELIKRNTEEILTEEELKKLLKEKKPVVYHGFEPSGKGIHIGYLIGINKLIDFQNAGFNVTILLADLHAWLNEKGNLEDIKKTAKIYDKSFRACGLKANKIVLGSDFQLEKDYIKDMMKMALIVTLKRSRRAMTMIGREEENPHVAQLLYPIMQTLDIKYLKADVAFGDMAQRHVHMLARETLPELDYKAPVCIHHIDLIGLKGGKMSCSIPDSNIMINEEPEIIKLKIKNAICPPKQIKDNPILQICKYLIFPKVTSFKIERDTKHGRDLILDSYPSLENIYTKGELHPLDLKNSVSDYLIDILKPIRKAL